LPVVILRTGRFFPEDDDTYREVSGPNRKANEFLNRRLTVEDAAEAHIAALRKAPELGFGLFIVSAPPPFREEEREALVREQSARAEAERRARELSLPAVALDTAMDNKAARTLYLGKGYEEVAYRAPGRKLPGFVALVKPLH
jgi:hypothetical protein